MSRNKLAIMVHGGWHGSWCWDRVMPQMQKLGFTEVLTPDLPGHGKNLAKFKDITLDSYVKSISSLVETAKYPVVLIGHSMAGVVISQVAEKHHSKISTLIYISGFVPDNDGCLVDEEKKAKHPSVALEIKVDEDEACISLDGSKKLRELFYNCTRTEDVDYALSHLQKQPLFPFLNRVHLTTKNFGSVKKLYIECLQDNAIHIEDQRRMNSKIDCEIVTINTDHSPFFSAQDELLGIIESTLLE